MSDSVQRLLRIGRNTVDLDRAIAFHRDALGFRVDDAAREAPTWTRLPGVCETPPRHALLRLGEQALELTAFDPPGALYPADSTSADLWFQHCAIVVDNMAVAHKRVMDHGATPITQCGPQTLPSSSGGVTAFKFRDPDGHPLELIAFPPGSDDPHWHEHAIGGVTLGIDHSALSVANIGRSIAFQHAMGLQVAARGVNRGDEQQRLDNLADVEVEVIALRPAKAATPHVEVLGYRNPRGRTLPRMQVRDIAADRLILQVGVLDTLLGKLREAHANIVSTGIVGPREDSRAALLRDPDGHWLVLAP